MDTHSPWFSVLFAAFVVTQYLTARVIVRRWESRLKRRLAECLGADYEKFLASQSYLKEPSHSFISDFLIIFSGLIFSAFCLPRIHLEIVSRFEEFLAPLLGLKESEVYLPQQTSNQVTVRVRLRPATRLRLRPRSKHAHAKGSSPILCRWLKSWLVECLDSISLRGKGDAETCWLDDSRNLWSGSLRTAAA